MRQNFDQDEYYYIVMDYVDGREMFEQVRRGGKTPFHSVELYCTLNLYISLSSASTAHSQKPMQLVMFEKQRRHLPLCTVWELFIPT